MVLNCFALWKQEPRSFDRGRPIEPARRISRRLDAFRHGGPHAPAPDRDRARHGGLQHAGHSARALWRQDPASAGRRDDGPDRDARARAAASGSDARRAPADARRGPAPGRRVGRGRRRRRLRRVIFSAALAASARCSALGVALIGFGGGLFAHGTLTASMASPSRRTAGLALGAWGAAQATAAGLAIAFSGVVNDRRLVARRAGRVRRGARRPRDRLFASSTPSRSCSCSRRSSRSDRSFAQHGYAQLQAAPTSFGSAVVAGFNPGGLR